MAIDFSSTFGARNARNNNANKADRSDLPKAQYWMNFGYMVAEGTDNERFVSLPTGIPLDTMERVSTRSSNQEYAQFQAARNDLLDQFVTLAESLQPGEFHIIRTEGDLAIQIRRVNEDQQAPATDESNPFARPSLFTVAKAA